jgi:hypothetical protein
VARIESPGIPPRLAENPSRVAPTIVPATPLEAPPSSEQSEARPVAQAGRTPFPHMAFMHIVLESRPDPKNFAMVPGVVPATAAALTTSFYDASIGATTPDSGPDGLQQKLTNLINTKRAYKDVGKNLAVSLVDLSGANKFFPQIRGNQRPCEFLRRQCQQDHWSAGCLSVAG